MATTPTTLRIRFDAAPFIRSTHDATQSIIRLGFAIRGVPAPPREPYPRHVSRQTARQYRAARRSYGRALAAWKRATR